MFLVKNELMQQIENVEITVLTLSGKASWNLLIGLGNFILQHLYPSFNSIQIIRFKVEPFQHNGEQQGKQFLLDL